MTSGIGTADDAILGQMHKASEPNCDHPAAWSISVGMQSDARNTRIMRIMSTSKRFDFVDNHSAQNEDNQYGYDSTFAQWETPPQHDHLDQTQDERYRYFLMGSLVSPGFTQTPTPIPSSSASDSEEPTDDDPGISVSVSTAFYPGAYNESSDTIFSTTDAVLFYVHSKVLMDATSHPFSSLLGAPLSDPRFRNHVISLAESSNVLTIILHMLYGTSSAQYSPSFDTLVIAVDQMPGYDIEPSAHIFPPTPLYSLLLSHAPFCPIELYTLAAHHRLNDLAVNTSSHLLSYSMCTLSDDRAERIGAVYLKRLLLLHLERFDALKDILLQPPNTHAPARECNMHDQQKLTRAWALAIAYLACDAKPDLSTYRVRSCLEPLADELNCSLCLQSLKDRIKNVVGRWASVKVTI